VSPDEVHFRDDSPAGLPRNGKQSTLNCLMGCTRELRVRNSFLFYFRRPGIHVMNSEVEFVITANPLTYRYNLVINYLSHCSLWEENKEARNKYLPTNATSISSAAEPTGTGEELPLEINQFVIIFLFTEVHLWCSVLTKTTSSIHLSRNRSHLKVWNSLHQGIYSSFPGWPRSNREDSRLSICNFMKILIHT